MAGDTRCIFDDSTNSTAFMNAFFVSHSPLFIKDFAHLAIDSCISIPGTFYHRQLGVMFCNRCTRLFVCLLVVTCPSVPLDFF